MSSLYGGRRHAASGEAIAAYDQTAAIYRGTVLSSFQRVEDNLAALRILEKEAQTQNKSVLAAQKSWNSPSRVTKAVSPATSKWPKRRAPLSAAGNKHLHKLSWRIAKSLCIRPDSAISFRSRKFKPP